MFYKRFTTRFARTLGGMMLAMLAVLSAQAQEVPALRITAPDGGTSLLLGTMHLGDPRIVQPSTTAVFDGAKRLVVESQPGPRAKPESPMDVLDPAAVATLLRTGKLGRAGWMVQLSPEDLQLLRARLACEVPADKVDEAFDALLAMKAWRATYAVALPCPRAAAESRDTMVVRAAQQRGIPIITLETPEEVQAQRDKLRAFVGERVFVDSMKASLGGAGAQLISGYINALNG